jgi:hypothetical protein
LSWYGITFSISFFVQLFIILVVFIWSIKFLGGGKSLLRLGARARLLRRQDSLIKLGFVGTVVIFLTVFVVFGFQYCDEGGCRNEFLKLLQSQPSEVGDTLAGISSALAFLWIIITVTMQSKELKAQRTELSLTRREHQLSREISDKTLRVLEHDSLLRDQQEAWRAFEAKLYEFLYAVEWHRKQRSFCKWLFGSEETKPSSKKGSDLVEIALDLFFKIRRRRKEVNKGDQYKGKDNYIIWAPLLEILEELVAMEEDLQEFGRKQLKIARLEATLKILKDVEADPNKWAEQEAWVTK